MDLIEQKQLSPSVLLAKSFSYRSNVSSRWGDRLVWPPVKPPCDKYHQRKHPEPGSKKTDFSMEVRVRVSVFTYHIIACSFFFMAHRKCYQHAPLQICSVRCCKGTPPPGIQCKRTVLHKQQYTEHYKHHFVNVSFNHQVHSGSTGNREILDVWFSKWKCAQIEELQRFVWMRTETWLCLRETDMMISNLWRSLENERISHQQEMGLTN